MSHGDDIAARPPGFRGHRLDRDQPDRGDRGRRRASSTGSSSTRRWRTPRRARKVLANFLDAAAAGATGTRARSSRRRPSAIREQVGRRARSSARSRAASTRRWRRCSCKRAIGERLTCVFVDNGLLRKDEARAGAQALRGAAAAQGGRSSTPRSRFLTRLAGVTDPERKRKIIGARVHRGLRGRDARRPGKAEFLAQGTLYPDVIESVSVHGPVGDDQEPPQRRRPAGADEAQAGRAAARAVQGRGAAGRASSSGLDEEFVYRQPFPGPGLAVRFLGAGDDASGSTLLREADAIFVEEIKAAGPLPQRSGRRSRCCCRCARSA